MVPGRLATAVGTVAAADRGGGRGVDGDDVVGECRRGRAEGCAEADGGGQRRRRGRAVMRDRYVVVMVLPLVRPGMGRYCEGDARGGVGVTPNSPPVDNRSRAGSLWISGRG